MTTLTPAAMFTTMHAHKITYNTIENDVGVDTCRCGMVFRTPLFTTYYETRPGTPSLPGIHAADQLAIAQGYTPTPLGPDQLDELPLGSIIKDANGTLFQQYRNVHHPTDVRWIAQTDIQLPQRPTEPVVIPATVLWTPEG